MHGCVKSKGNKTLVKKNKKENITANSTLSEVKEASSKASTKNNFLACACDFS